MKAAEAQQEHHWLHKLVGNWTCEIEAVMAPGQAPEKSTGSERVRSLGGLWVICEGEMPGEAGASHQSVMTLGYDPRRQRFVGTFIASMMTHLWLYDGTLDADGRTLTLDTEGPSFADPGKLARYRDVIEFLSDDHRTLSSFAHGDDEQWNRFMTAHYRRAK